MFGKQKGALRERRFASEGEVKDVVYVYMWLWSKLKTFSAGGIRRLVKATTTRVEKQ
jgi:hypothetical protein